jgi:hypothetical protein
MNFHIYFHADSRFENLLSDLNQRIKYMTTELDQLRASVAANTSVTASALALIQGFKAQLDAARASPDDVAGALTELSASLDANDTALAAAVAANTPAAQPAPAAAAAPAVDPTA